ncbi:MAG TPA: metallophosphoesterase [Opitutaceae bacterium]|nr:metallophosphoesterase [Opitutaceae bacterium]
MNLRLSLAVLLLAAGSARAESTRPLAPLPLPAPAAALAPAPDPDHFMFSVGGDNRAAGRGVPMPPTAGQIFSELQLIRPAFSLWTGDSIYGSDDTVGEARAEYATFLALAATAGIPVFNAPGNHEIYQRRDLEELYQRTMGRLYGSFDYGHSHFIAIDTEEVGPKAGVGPAQMAWIRQDLEANRGAANIFVFSHHPLFPKGARDGFDHPANRDELHRLFVQYGVRAVFSGHEHLYYRSKHDGIDYIVTGGGGAPSEEGPEEGGAQHYALVYVNGGQISVAVLAPWRLFSWVGPVQPDGSCSALLANYNAADFNATVDFPTTALAGRAAVRSVFTYKGVSRALAAEIVPSRSAGTISVRTALPKAGAVTVSIFPERPRSGN